MIWLIAFTTYCILNGKSYLDLNTSSVEYLWFDFTSFTFWATCLNAHSQNIHVLHEFFNGLADDANASCPSFLFEPILSLSLFEFV
jgi:hypothetical protein